MASRLSDPSSIESKLATPRPPGSFTPSRIWLDTNKPFGWRRLHRVQLFRSFSEQLPRRVSIWISKVNEFGRIPVGEFHPIADGSSRLAPWFPAR